MFNKKKWTREYQRTNKKRRKYAKSWWRKNWKRYNHKRKEWRKLHPIKAKRASIRHRTENWKKYRYQWSQRTAKVRKKGFQLSLKFYFELLEKSCHYCGRECEKKYFGTWMDRINNNRGYYRDNVLPCCPTCNRLRGDYLTVDEAKVAVQAVIAYRVHREASANKL